MQTLTRAVWHRTGGLFDLSDLFAPLMPMRLLRILLLYRVKKSGVFFYCSRCFNNMLLYFWGFNYDKMAD